MIIRPKKKTILQRAKDNGVHFYVYGVMLLIIAFTHLWVRIT